MSRLSLVRVALAALFAVLWAPTPSQAAECVINRQEILKCDGTGGSVIQNGRWTKATKVDGDWWTMFNQIWTTEKYLSCGTNYDYDQNQDVYLLNCRADNYVDIRIENMRCDMDLFVLANGCGSGSPCPGHSTRSGGSPENATVQCNTGDALYIVVERYDETGWDFWNWGDGCQSWNDFSYTINITCYEDCDNRKDDDGDGLIDCQDPDCPACFEDCANGIDDDFDGKIDCADEDCFKDNRCCDQDGDGYWAMGLCGGDDCDDSNTEINPGRPEIPADGVDSNCDGYEDCYLDADNDFYGVPLVVQSSQFFCLAPGVSTNADDCDDSNPNIHPGAIEIVANGIDENCDGMEVCFVDNDNDTYGSTTTDLTQDVTCTAGGHSLNSDDCDDADFTVHPGAVDYPVSGKDEDCDGLEICYEDRDGDGFGGTNFKTSPIISCVGTGVSPLNTDCDDTPGSGLAIHPGALEGVADGIDQNCDLIELCWLDGDHDGFGNMDGVTTNSSALDCSTLGASLSANDCNDSDPTIYPGAPDPFGDGIDQNCDGANDCYVDNDGDGYGSTLIQSSVPNCASPGLAPSGGDCDDTNPAIHPGATEIVANGVDENCDGNELCYEDLDEDGYGSTQTTLTTDLTCTLADHVSTKKTDCDDTDPFIHPGALEIPADGIDQDCDGKEVCFVDADNDGFGTPQTTLSTTLDCSTSGLSTNTLDCDDGNKDVHPGAIEIPINNRDDDCDGFERCYIDGDGDTFGKDALINSADLTCLSPGVAVVNNDCDDTNPLIYPGATTPPGHTGDGVNYSCDGLTTCYVDNDGDGYGSHDIASVSGDPACAGAGVSPNNLDCDPGNPNINPSAIEIPLDGIDQNCDGYETCYKDADGDGFGGLGWALDAMPSTCHGPGVSPNNLDCNDDPSNGGKDIYPGAFEVIADGIDQNCDGLELCYRDNDRDTYGSPDTSLALPSNDFTCKASGIANNPDDCDDTQFRINPGATEIIADGVDQDCDGLDACWVDADGDSFGSQIPTTGQLGLRCMEPGVSPNNLDCYDVPPDGATIYPGAPEIPGDGIDQDCDGTEACFYDNDGDGYGKNSQPYALSTNFQCIGPNITTVGGDCNDANPNINPGASENPADGIDQNCDGLELCYVDADHDTFGSQLTTTSPDMTCRAVGVSPNNLDCLDIPPEGASVYPGAPEIIGDGIDQDCDGMEVCYLDGDFDGFGGSKTGKTQYLDCEAPGYAKTSDDCNDNETSIHPGATEVPADGIDQDCDGKEYCYADNDGDGVGTPTRRDSSAMSCVATGVSPYNDDCYDSLPGGDLIHPGHPGSPASTTPPVHPARPKIDPGIEIPGDGIDSDCDLLELCYADDDKDGFGTATKPLRTSPSMQCESDKMSTNADDCDDTNASIFPGATEIAVDGIDQDCDGVDLCYVDADRDGFGNAAGDTTPGANLACNTSGVSNNTGDCLDRGFDSGVPAADIHPGATEVCNGADDNCNGLIDDADPGVQAGSSFTWFLDHDNDGYGTTSVTMQRCNAPDDGNHYSTIGGDCKDNNPNVNPGAQEVCNGDIDDDCNGLADNADIVPGNPKDLRAIDAVLVYPDVDKDTWGDNDTTKAYETCTPGSGATRTGDCNDKDPNVNPGMPETPYNGKDDDCNTATPDDDLDGDGYKVLDPNPSLRDCNDLPGVGLPIHPGMAETCNGIDDDCNGLVDDTTECYDDDGDGFTELAGDCDDHDRGVYPGAPESPAGNGRGDRKDNNCNAGKPGIACGGIDEGTLDCDDDGDGYSEMQGDCNDGDPNVNPGKTEIAGNGIDDDCDGIVDDGAYDGDHDGYTVAGGDCNDANPLIRPGAPELPNGIDDNCNAGKPAIACGGIDEGTVNCDDDGDGFSEVNGDCNDDNPNIYPGAPEIAGNGIDDNCNGIIDEGANDADGDGYSVADGDCDDSDPNIHPGATENPDNYKDDNCNGFIDEGSAHFDDDGDGYCESPPCVPRPDLVQIPADQASRSDCDDNNGWVRPGGVEICHNGIDDDCDPSTPDDCDNTSGLIGGEEEHSGCGCQHNDAPLSTMLTLAGLGLLTLRRRRSGAHRRQGSASAS